MNKKYYIGFLILTVIFSYLFSKTEIFGATGIRIDKFDLNPKVVPTTSGGKTQFQMTLRVTIDVAQFNKSCGSNTNKLAWYVYAGAGIKKASGEAAVNRTAPTLSLTLDKKITVDVSAPELRGGTFDYYAAIYCPGTFGDKLSESGKVKITFGTGSTTDKNYACIDANNKYACSPSNLTNCSDVAACSGQSCVQIGKNLCGQDAGTEGRGTPGEGEGKPGQTTTTFFEFKNPIVADNFTDLIKIIGQWIFNLAIPIAVIMILYAGFLWLTAGARPANVAKAKTVFWYAILGLVIIFIGQGFLSLIRSILELGK